MPKQRTSRSTSHRSHAQLRRRVRLARPWHRRLALHPATILVLLLAGVLIVGWTWYAAADSYGITGKVAAPALTEGAVISEPADGATFTASPITITGTCPNSSYVTIIRNGVFAGVGGCAVDNTFSIDVSLSPGANTLQAQDYNTTDDPGPVTPGITVYYSPPAPPPASVATKQPSRGSSAPLPLLLASDYSFHAVTAGSDFSWIIVIKGGVAPYTVSINWGDGSVTVSTYPEATSITITHAYKNPGYYPILVTITDAAGNSTTLQLAAFIKAVGAAGFAFNANNDQGGAQENSLLALLVASKWLLVAWPAYSIIVLMIISFWLGERQQVSRLMAQPVRVQPRVGRRSTLHR